MFTRPATICSLSVKELKEPDHHSVFQSTADYVGVYVNRCLTIFLLVGVAYNSVLCWKLQAQINQQRVVLNKINNKVYYLQQHQLYDETQASTYNGSLRSKRQITDTSQPGKPDKQLHLAHIFRWMQINSSDDVSLPKFNYGRKKRQQKESKLLYKLNNDEQLSNNDDNGKVVLQPPPNDSTATYNLDIPNNNNNMPLNIRELQHYCLTMHKFCKDNPGLPGLPGAPGIAGPKGEKGDRGPTGLEGIDGIPGEPGMEGIPGRDGRDGKPGVPGLPGLNGSPGRNGIDGKPGQKGELGIRGPVGPPGPQGKAGPPGAEGKPGAQVQAWIHNNKSLLIAPTIGGKNKNEQTIEVKESGNVSLACPATGQPKPLITWQRRQNQNKHIQHPILVNETAVNFVQSKYRNFTPITRDDFGIYVCVADNGVPPAASMTVNLRVIFPPLIKISLSQQMVPAVKGSWAVLVCYVDGFPTPYVNWYYGETVLDKSAKYDIQEEMLEMRMSEVLSKRVWMNITRVTSADYGLYKCMAHNRLGRTYGRITLFESDTKQTPVDEENTDKRDSLFAIYGERPKLVQCEPCPSCSPCGKGQWTEIVNIRDSSIQESLLNYTSSQSLSKRTSQCYLSQIGKPVYYNDYGGNEIGCWMRDPKPIKPADEEKYWLTRISSNQLLEEFSSKENFRNRVVTRNYTLMHRFSGNAQTIYAGSFYYAEEGTTKLIIFNLETFDSSFINLDPGIVRRVRSHLAPYKPYHRHTRSHTGRRQRSVSLTKKESGKRLPRLYTNQLNLMDISADENGLWMVFPNWFSEANYTSVIKFNGTKIEDIWNLTVDYHQLGDSFVMCGVLYGVQSVTQHSTNISFAYDLYQNKELKHLKQIEFTNPFLSTQYIGYNARYQKLYTWDKGNLLEYPLKIDNEMTTTTTTSKSEN